MLKMLKTFCVFPCRLEKMAFMSVEKPKVFHFFNHLGVENFFMKKIHF